MSAAPTHLSRQAPVRPAGRGAIHLKREDLNHTGAHKINHCLGEALLAKFMGKKKVIAETGAGQHGVALATACALVGIPCEIHMGQVDIEKEHPNVTKMRILGCNLVPVTRGAATLKEAVDSAFEVYLQDPVNTIYAIGSVVGPHPFPMMVRDFQSIVGREAREQFQAKHGRLPDHVAACVGGGSNAMGIFTAFLDDASVHLVGVEPAGEGVDKPGRHAATITMGKPGEIHGMKCYVLENDDGTPAAVHSIASGLDYPGVGPQHSYLKDIGRVDYQHVDDKECLDAFMTLSRVEGIILPWKALTPWPGPCAWRPRWAGPAYPRQPLGPWRQGRGLRGEETGSLIPHPRQQAGHCTHAPACSFCRCHKAFTKHRKHPHLLTLHDIHAPNPSRFSCSDLACRHGFDRLRRR